MRRILAGALLTGLLVAAIATAAGSAPQKGVDPKAGVADLSGVWRFDPERSDKPPERMGGGGHGGMRGGHGGMHGGGMHGGPGGPPAEGGAPSGPEGRGGRPGRLPDVLHIAQHVGYVSIEDSTDTEIVRITTDVGPSAPANVMEAQGRWKDGKLEAVSEPREGVKITQTYALKDKGATLEVKTKIEGRRTFEMKRVFAREKA